MIKRLISLWCTALVAFSLVSCNPFEKDDDEEEEIEKKTSDWLILSYLDADNNLNDSLYDDLVNEQRGLAKIAETEGAPSVRILALWDGEAEEEVRTDRNTRIHPNGALYELGAMDETTYQNLNSGMAKGFVVSANTSDLTSSVSWLKTEPDMSDVDTLKAFLSWANKYYSATNVVLLLSDHGAGTEYETYSGGIKGYYNDSRTASRSLCSDETNGGGVLTALDVKNAISASGLSVNVIWQDCCLQGNAETAYGLAGSADYLVTSANLSYSNDHYSVISSLADSSSTPLSFAKAVVKAYAEYHENTVMEETKYRASFDTVLTQAVYNLSRTKQTALYSAIGSLASALIADSAASNVYANYVAQDGSSLANCKGMAYGGSYVYLNDIGYFSQNLASDSTVTANTRTAAQNVITALGNIIECSWLGKQSASDSSPYYVRNLDGYTGQHDSEGIYGLTIATQIKPDCCKSDGTEYSGFPLYSYYSELTGYSDKWGELLKVWYADKRYQ